jgi:hypothetical protein
VTVADGVVGGEGGDAAVVEGRAMLAVLGPARRWAKIHRTSDAVVGSGSRR